MNLQHVPTTAAEETYQGNVASNGLQGYWLVPGRIVWIAVVAFILTSFFAGIPAFHAMLQNKCTTAACRTIIAPYTVRYIEAGGLSINFFLIYTYGLFIISLLAYLIIGAVLFWFRSHDRMALYTSFALVTFPMAFNSSLMIAFVPSLWLPVQIVSFVNEVAFVAFFYLFPNGRFVPRWVRWLVVASIVYAGVECFFPNSPLASFWLIGSLFPCLLISGVVVQVYRYLKVSNQVERQQTKWVVYGVSISSVGTLAVIGLYYFNTFSIFHPNSRSDLVAGGVLYMFVLLIPLAIAFAVLRSRLWDIDIIINRTLVYATLTGILGLVYAGSILLLQYLLRGIIQQNNGVVIVISTLLIAALFQPLRHRIQANIDRRFYRRKYNAAKTVADFSATLRNEVDLATLREHLVAIVQETMQPTQVSLWLRPSEHDGKQRAPWRATPPTGDALRKDTRESYM